MASLGQEKKYINIINTEIAQVTSRLVKILTMSEGCNSINQLLKPTLLPYTFNPKGAGS